MVPKGLRARQDLEGSPARYHGYRVRVYYRDQLQDESAMPKTLLVQGRSRPASRACRPDTLMLQRAPISACVIVFNEERKIRRCLESLTWCEEIVVLDSFSTDHTVEICREYTDRVFQHVWLGYVGQRNKIRQLATLDWILNIDSDEEVSPGLRRKSWRPSPPGPARCAASNSPARSTTWAAGSATASGIPT
jgi:hypothetical protein